MRKIMNSAVLALGALALAAPAAAQFGPGGPQPAAPLWGDSTEYASKKPIFSADLGTGGPSSFTAVYDEAKGELCYILSAPGLDQPTMAHIHQGGPGENGKVVVPLANPDGGSSGGCVAITADVAKALLADPNAYYVNVHTAAAPGGYVRAQLTRRAPRWSA